MPSHSRKAPTLKPPKPALPPTPEALHTLVSKIPTKTLHAYVLTHLPTAPPATLAALASFFATLRPPPRLHCVPHDEDSGHTEWVSSIGRNDSEYETRFSCCGKIVDGEGDMGPPDGWCYEGMHTMDVKRAHFRADSTSSDDMLDSCSEVDCRLPDPRPRVDSSTGNVRVNGADSDDDDDDSNAKCTEDSGIVEIVNSVGAIGQKAKGPRRTKAVARKVTAWTLARAHVSNQTPRGASNAESSRVRKRRKLAGAA
ncbi:hypothetical protein H4582DRAFT_2068250 [Lactarius indigo]|nr:hypothetical protein H4582DRAFT_2068250 [Lactarius indigo]